MQPLRRRRLQRLLAIGVGVQESKGADTSQDKKVQRDYDNEIHDQVSERRSPHSGETRSDDQGGHDFDRCGRTVLSDDAAFARGELVSVNADRKGEHLTILVLARTCPQASPGGRASGPEKGAHRHGDVDRDLAQGARGGSTCAWLAGVALNEIMPKR